MTDIKKTISVAQLQEKLTKKENIIILDVRPSDQRDEWKIADSVHVDAYKKLNVGDDTALDQVEIPERSTVVTVCSAGRTSLLASLLMERKGVKAYSLEGGMKAWNYAWNIAEVQFANFKIIQVRRVAKGVLSYVVGSAGEAIVIDAALDPIVYQTLAKQNGWTIKYVMDTHIHADYVSRTRDLAQASGARHLLIEGANVTFNFEAVRNHGVVKFGNSEIEFVHSPGHTWESTTFKLDNSVIFTGDTLFIDGIGRPDLNVEKNEGIEKSKALYTSLKNLISLNPDMRVFPAHTSSAVNFDDKLIQGTITEIKSKVNALALRESDFIEYTLTRIPPTPPNYQTITLINRNGSYEGKTLGDLEAGGNHCAIA
jgi:glyoxylase-like metal-dependent hydrolase (beta-lactamase superfamily II)/rhodanese-related sulfurtransferase